MEYKKLKVLQYDFFVVVEDDSILSLDTSDYFIKKYNVKTESQNNFECITTQLFNYFKGKIKILNFKTKLIGTDFQKKVWEVLEKVPYGKTVSYSSLAEKLGDKNKVRAVANAVSKNPILIKIPCHRVIGLDGKLHGFRAGIKMKEKLLQLEKTFNE